MDSSSKEDHALEDGSSLSKKDVVASLRHVERERLALDPKIRRKVDWNVIPLIALLYLCSFLDRGNIGNARIAGIVTDLKLTGIKYQMCAAVFFIPYSLMEVPSQVVLKLTRPSLFIPAIMVGWGLVMFCMAFVKSYHDLLIARIFLGLTEAGLAPGVAWYITLWYRKQDQARAISLYFSSATVSGAFGGFLAFAIMKLDGRGGLKGWAWIFLIEGLITIAASVVAYLCLPDHPTKANFLTQSEKQHLLDVLKRDQAGESTHFEWKFVWEVLRNPLSWLLTVVYVGMLMPLYAFSIFLPTIIKDLGFASNSETQLLTIPPYALGCAATIALGMLSDRYKIRGPFIMICAFMGIVGYAMLYATSPKIDPGVGYAGTMLAAMGVYPTVPIMLAWGSNNAGGSLHKGVVIGMLSGFGNLGGICSSFIYRTQDSPRFHLGHGIVIGFLCMSFVASGVATYTYNRLNKAKDVLCEREGIRQDESDSDVYANMGTASPLFRYSL